jgi:hypothetical protein
MNITEQLAKIGLYSLTEIAERENLDYLIAGGMAIQAHAFSQFHNYIRPTLDTDIIIKKTPYPTFVAGYGADLGRLLKNKFGVHTHLYNHIHSNAVGLLTQPNQNSKQVFLLCFARYAMDIEDKTPEEALKYINENRVLIPLNDLNITDENIQTKSKITNTASRVLAVRTPELELKNKRFQMQNKLKLNAEIRPEYARLRTQILGNDNPQLNHSMDSLYEQILIDSNNSAKYEVEKDIFDYVLLTKIIGK